MAHVTLYVVQFFSRQGRKLAADQPLSFKTKELAIGRAERGMATKAGVIVTVRSGDPEADDWDEPELLLKQGQLPRGMADED
jgi:hypothetical protein